MIRCGTDIVYIPSVASKLKNDAVLRKFFHAGEVRNGSMEHLAGVLAAKEAFFKALGIVPKFLDIELKYESGGRPYINAAPQWQLFKHCDVSISHDKDYAFAVVVIVTGEGNIPY